MNCFTLLTGRIIFCFDFEALLGAYQGTHMVTSDATQTP